MDDIEEYLPKVAMMDWSNCRHEHGFWECEGNRGRCRTCLWLLATGGVRKNTSLLDRARRIYLGMKRGLSVGQIARENQWSKATVFRDMKAIQAALCTATSS